MTWILEPLLNKERKTWYSCLRLDFGAWRCWSLRMNPPTTSTTLHLHVRRLCSLFHSSSMIVSFLSFPFCAVKAWHQAYPANFYQSLLALLPLLCSLSGRFEGQHRIGHVNLYGDGGNGKTTAARMALRFLRCATTEVLLILSFLLTFFPLQFLLLFNYC